MDDPDVQASPSDNHEGHRCDLGEGEPDNSGAGFFLHSVSVEHRDHATDDLRRSKVVMKQNFTGGVALAREQR